MIKFPGSPPRMVHSVSLTDGRRGSSCRQLCQLCQAGPVGVEQGASRGAQRTLRCTRLPSLLPQGM